MIEAARDAAVDLILDPGGEVAEDLLLLRACDPAVADGLVEP
jgi:hypothetical protein